MPTRTQRRSWLLGGPGIVLALALAPPAVAGAAAAAPQLSIAIDNGRTAAAAGDALTYTITVKNLGAAAVDGLHVSQTMPPGLTLATADGEGRAEAGKVTWRVDLPASGTATRHTTMTVGETPVELLRLATVACASPTAADPPLVCASHSDQLPAGAAAAAAAADQATGPGDDRSSSGRTAVYVAGAGGILLTAVPLAVLFARRRRSG